MILRIKNTETSKEYYSALTLNELLSPVDLYKIESVLFIPEGQCTRITDIDGNSKELGRKYEVIVIDY